MCAYILMSKLQMDRDPFFLRGTDGDPNLHPQSLKIVNKSLTSPYVPTFPVKNVLEKKYIYQKGQQVKLYYTFTATDPH